MRFKALYSRLTGSKTLKEIFKGVLIGFAIFLVPYITLYALLSGLPGGPGVGTALAILSPFILSAFVAVIVVLNIIVSTVLSKRKRGHMAIGVWLFIPIAVGLYIAYGYYYNLRVYLASMSDYSARNLEETLSPANNLFIYPGGVNVPYFRSSDESFIDMLRKGVFRAISRPSRDSDSKYFFPKYDFPKYPSLKYPVPKNAVLRYVEGDKCRLAQAGSGYGPFLAKHLTKLLERNGYFGGCITVEYADNFDYDVRIRQGPLFCRSYAPCKNVADIYERRSGADVLLGRWEYGRVSVYFGAKIRINSGKPFEIIDIISVLKSSPVEERLKRFEFKSISAELERIADLSEKGTFYSSVLGPASWIRHVFSTNTKNSKFTRNLTAGEKSSLRRIMLNMPMNYRREHLIEYKYLLSDQDANELLDWVGTNNRRR